MLLPLPLLGADDPVSSLYRDGTFLRTEWRAAMRTEANRGEDSDRCRSRLTNGNPLDAGESRLQRSGYRRWRKRRLNTDDTVRHEPRPDRGVFIKRPHRRPVRDQLEKLDLPRFFKRSKICTGVIFVAPALGDHRTHCAGMLTIEGGGKCLGYRGGHRARNQHSSPRRTLQQHPVRPTKI